jgi:ATP-dependent RNA helicase DeaD
VRAEKPAYVPKPPRVVEDEAAEEAPKPKAKYDERPRVTPTEARPEWKADRPARKPYEDRAPRAEATAEAPKKPRWTPDQKSAPRSAGFKSHGGSADRPGRAAGFKSHASEGGGYKGKPENYKPRGEGAAAADGERPARKPYAGKTEGYKPRAEYAPRADGDRPARKPYAGKSEGYKPRSEGFKPREDGERPKKPYAPKVEGFRPKEDGDRPKKTYAPKGDDARPYVKREGAGKPAGKSFGTKKPFDRAGADRPAKPKADARDTSKRFVPPKGPKR